MSLFDFPGLFSLGLMRCKRGNELKGLTMTEKHPRTAAHYETPINILLLSEYLRERD